MTFTRFGTTPKRCPGPSTFASVDTGLEIYHAVARATITRIRRQCQYGPPSCHHHGWRALSWLRHARIA
jgi:hypothetical protein